MKTRFLGRVMACAAATALLASGCKPGGADTHVAAASAHAPGAARDAAQFAAMGESAIRMRNGAQAVMMTEHAVALTPGSASYRAQLGQSYLLAGRFASAIEAFRDAVALRPGDGRALLALALAQGALDRHDGVRESVAAAAGRIGDPDRGLALALAGDAAAAVALLEPAARAPDASPRTRQNLALAYALAGRWDRARAIAAQDLAPDALDARMAAWARLAGPQPTVDRIAAFLGVTPAVVDDGMPTQLALSHPAQAPAMLAVAEPPAVSVPVAAPAAVAPSAEVAVAETPAPAVVPMRTAVPEAPAPVAPPAFMTYVAARGETVGPVRRAVARAVAPPPSLLMRATYMPPVRGAWVVQLGAYSSGRSIEAAWTRISGRVRPVARMEPLTSTIRSHGMLFQRLAVGGIATRGQAVTLCEAVRAAGGVCFVRGTADEAPIRYAMRRDGKGMPVRLASR